MCSCSGYDSAGVGFIRKGASSITVIKKAGKVANLKDATATQDCSSTIGIAHTRWATHGPPDDKNAHPHFSADKSVAVVHNGIIENYRELQTMLEKLHGYVFASQTDTELLAHLAHFVSRRYSCSRLFVVTATMEVLTRKRVIVVLSGAQAESQAGSG